MRTLVDIPDNDIEQLDLIARRDKLSRAELLRQAVALYLDREKQKASDAAVDDYFGYLKNAPDAFGGKDAIAYQNDMRTEWEQPETDYSKWAMHDSGSSEYRGK
jgi:metal-responsive CopG/Arc/MetJ family transcriptional regulator